jgi:anti-sigma regulatory factor (Ser/Thr protein kinase)
VERLSERLGFPGEQARRMVLAVDEACTNVIRHAYGGRSGGRIRISFTIDTARLEIQIRDFGRTTSPDALKPRDLNDIRPGGLGMHFIREGMDEVSYEAPADGGGLLRLIRYLPQQKENQT